MRLEYYILWVEDDESWFETTRELFSDTLEELGFKLVAKQCSNIDEVREEVDNNGLKFYDLLLIDYTLQNSDSGDKIIEFIRNIKDSPILTDVLFYSSAVEKVRESMHTLGLEGVYTADRKFIEDKFNLVFSTTIKKVQEVNTIRGLIMAETSDLDDLMLEIIDQMLKTDISKDLATYINEIISDSTNSISQIALSEETTVDKKIKDSRIFTSFHKAKAINRIYKLTEIGRKKFFHSYYQDVISPRNIFAHVKETFEDGKQVLISHSTGKKEIFNEERCVEIRTKLIEYRNFLEEIKEQVIVP